MHQTLHSLLALTWCLRVFEGLEVFKIQFEEITVLILKSSCVVSRSLKVEIFPVCLNEKMESIILVQGSGVSSVVI